MVAPEPQEGNLVCASGTGVERGVKRRIAQRVQKASLASAFHMEVVGAASSQHVQRVHKEAQCFARLMAGAKGAQFWGAQRVQRAAHPSVRVMVVGSDAHSKEEVCAQRVCMVVPSFVLLMVVERDVLFPIAQRVQGEGPIFVFVMVGVSGANMRGVERVPRAAPTSARHMVEASGVLGGTQGQSFVVKPRVTGLLGVRPASVLRTVPWYKTIVCMVVAHLVSPRIHKPANLRLTI